MNISIFARDHSGIYRVYISCFIILKDELEKKEKEIEALHVLKISQERNSGAESVSLNPQYLHSHEENLKQAIKALSKQRDELLKKVNELQKEIALMESNANHIHKSSDITPRFEKSELDLSKMEVLQEENAEHVKRIAALESQLMNLNSSIEPNAETLKRWEISLHQKAQQLDLFRKELDECAKELEYRAQHLSQPQTQNSVRSLCDAYAQTQDELCEGEVRNWDQSRVLSSVNSLSEKEAKLQQWTLSLRKQASQLSRKAILLSSTMAEMRRWKTELTKREALLQKQHHSQSQMQMNLDNRWAELDALEVELSAKELLFSEFTRAQTASIDFGEREKDSFMLEDYLQNFASGVEYTKTPTRKSQDLPSVQPRIRENIDIDAAHAPSGNHEEMVNKNRHHRNENSDWLPENVFSQEISLVDLQNTAISQAASTILNEEALTESVQSQTLMGDAKSTGTPLKRSQTQISHHTNVKKQDSVSALSTDVSTRSEGPEASEISWKIHDSVQRDEISSEKLIRRYPITSTQHEERAPSQLEIVDESLAERGPDSRHGGLEVESLNKVKIPIKRLFNISTLLAGLRAARSAGFTRIRRLKQLLAHAKVKDQGVTGTDLESSHSCIQEKKLHQWLNELESELINTAEKYGDCLPQIESILQLADKDDQDNGGSIIQENEYFIASTDQLALVERLVIQVAEQQAIKKRWEFAIGDVVSRMKKMQTVVDSPEKHIPNDLFGDSETPVSPPSDPEDSSGEYDVLSIIKSPIAHSPLKQKREVEGNSEHLEARIDQSRVNAQFTKDPTLALSLQSLRADPDHIGPAHDHSTEVSTEVDARSDWRETSQKGLVSEDHTVAMFATGLALQQLSINETMEKLNSILADRKQLVDSVFDYEHSSGSENEDRDSDRVSSENGTECGSPTNQTQNTDSFLRFIPRQKDLSNQVKRVDSSHGSENKSHKRQLSANIHQTKLTSHLRIEPRAIEEQCVPELEKRFDISMSSSGRDFVSTSFESHFGQLDVSAIPQSNLSFIGSNGKSSEEET